MHSSAGRPGVTAIIGGSGAIGAATARRMAKSTGRHDRISVIGYCRDRHTADTVRAEIETLAQSKHDCHTIPVDLSDPGSIDRFFQKIAELGTLETLVNAGGIFLKSPLTPQTGETSDDALEQVTAKLLEVNVTGVAKACRLAVDLMKPQSRGAIVNIASASALRATSNSIAYSMSKSAIITLTANLAYEVRQFGINVNAVAPGLVRTDMSKELFLDEVAVERIRNNTPAKRIATPDDIACVIEFLTTEAASWIVGQTITVDGGASLPYAGK